MARHPRTVWAVEDDVQPVRSLGSSGSLGAALQGVADRGRRRRVPHRRHYRPSAPRRRGRKRGVQSNALGRSRGGFSSKLHAVSTTEGKPLEVTLTAGQVHDSVEAEHLLLYAKGKAVIADSAYDADRIIEAVKER